MPFYDAVRRALLKVSPEARPPVLAALQEAERSVQASLDARVHEADVARRGWKTEQDTSAALRAEVNRLQAELNAARESMATAALNLLSQSGMASNDSKAA